MSWAVLTHKLYIGVTVQGTYIIIYKNIANIINTW